MGSEYYNIYTGLITSGGGDGGDSCIEVKHHIRQILIILMSKSS